MLSEKSILESLKSYKNITPPPVNGYYYIPEWLMCEVIEHFERVCEGTKIGINSDAISRYTYYCGKCGSRVFLDDDYCGKCGTMLKWPNEQEFNIMRNNLRENNL